MVRQTVRVQIDRKERSHRVGRGVCNGDSHGVDVRMEAMASSEEDDCGEASSRSEAKGRVANHPERSGTRRSNTKTKCRRCRSGKGGKGGGIPWAVTRGDYRTLGSLPLDEAGSGCYRVARNPSSKVTIFLTLVKMKDGTRRVIASSPNGTIDSASIDIPTQPIINVETKPLKWTCGAVLRTGL